MRIGSGPRRVVCRYRVHCTTCPSTPHPNFALLFFSEVIDQIQPCLTRLPRTRSQKQLPSLTSPGTRPIRCTLRALDCAAAQHDCSVRRRHQKIVEVTPAMTLPEEIRQGILTCAVKLASNIPHRKAGTPEFWVPE